MRAYNKGRVVMVQDAPGSAWRCSFTAPTIRLAARAARLIERGGEPALVYADIEASHARTVGCRPEARRG